MKIREELADMWGDDLLFADGFDDAIAGVCVGFDSGRVAYSVPKMIEACMEWTDSYEEAVEWLEFNTFGAYVGDNTPIYFDDETITLISHDYSQDEES
jgi:hypothetical protein